MKNLLPGIFMFTLFACKTVPPASTKPSAGEGIAAVPADSVSGYKHIMGSSIQQVMARSGLTDTTGLTFPARFPQADPDVTYLVLKMPSGEWLAFNQGSLQIIMPNH